MKKVYILFLMLAVLLGLSACNIDERDTGDTSAVWSDEIEDISEETEGVNEGIEDVSSESTNIVNSSVNEPVVDQKLGICTLETAEKIVNRLLPQSLKDKGYHIVYDREVEFNDYTTFAEDDFYRFLIEDSQIALESAFLVNKETGVAIICYPDDTFNQARSDSFLVYDESIWQGTYWKDLSEELENSNYYTVFSVAQSEDDCIFVSVDSYYGHGSMKMHFVANIDSENKNKANVTTDYYDIDLLLNDDNTISVTVNKGEPDVLEALDGLMV